MNPATATRQEIRQFVEGESAELRKFAEQGGNPHQMSLDQKDRLEANLAHLTDEEREKFYAIYIEEMNANTAQVMADTQKMNQQAFEIEMNRAQGQQSGYLWATVIIAMAITALFVFRK
jgi:DNA-directed RNA polymerase specialized sigma24 family protein